MTATHSASQQTPDAGDHELARHPVAGPRPHPSLRALQPLVRLDARIAQEAQRPWEQAPVRRRNTFTLHREQELPAALRRSGTPEISADGLTDGDRRRPTDLATHREERRQVIAVSRLICHATMEAMTGARPVQQLRRWLEHTVYSKVCERAELLQHTRELTVGHPTLGSGAERRAPRPLSLLRVRARQVETGIWEVSVIFSEADRTRACALRLEAHRGRWRAVALELG